MNVLFLDIDGPLVTLDDPKETRYGRMNVFDEKCVNALNDIWRFTQCEIVISSDWILNNFDHKLQTARNVFQHNNVQAPIIGFVRKRPTSNPRDLEIDRCNEILEWVGTHNPDKWVAVDDMTLHLLEEKNFALVDSILGLSDASVKERIISLLSN